MMLTKSTGGPTSLMYSLCIYYTNYENLSTLGGLAILETTHHKKSAHLEYGTVIVEVQQGQDNDTTHCGSFTKRLGLDNIFKTNI
jgi:hypothetical protein